MTRKNFTLFLSGLVLILGSFSCSEEIKPTPLTYTRVFTGENSKTWKLDRVLLREKGKAEEEIALETCERDDEYTFYNNAERLYEVTNAQFSCDTDEPETLVSYVWAFSNANATLTIVIPHFFGNFIIPFIVREVEDETMELEIFLDEDNTISYVFYFEAINEN